MNVVRCMEMLIADNNLAMYQEPCPNSLVIYKNGKFYWKTGGADCLFCTIDNLDNWEIRVSYSPVAEDVPFISAARLVLDSIQEKSFVAMPTSMRVENGKIPDKLIQKNLLTGELCYKSGYVVSFDRYTTQLKWNVYKASDIFANGNR